MYSENHRRASVSRANDEFLRRMIGGELTGGERMLMNIESPMPAVPNRLEQGSERISDEGNPNVGYGRLSNEGNQNAENNRPSCNGSVGNGNNRPSCNGSVGNENNRPSCRGDMNDENNRPSCRGDMDDENSNHSNGGDCPTHVHAPSLAIVYSPRQCWRNLIDPQSALENGTLFAELILPLEVERGNCNRETEVRSRKCCGRTVL